MKNSTKTTATAKNSDTKTTETTEVKVVVMGAGEIAQKVILEVIGKNAKVKGTLCKDASKKDFKIPYTVLAKTDDVEGKLKQRYYKDEIVKGYKLCSQWGVKHYDLLKTFAEDHNVEFNYDRPVKRATSSTGSSSKKVLGAMNKLIEGLTTEEHVAERKDVLKSIKNLPAGTVINGVGVDVLRAFDPDAKQHAAEKKELANLKKTRRTMLASKLDTKEVDAKIAVLEHKEPKEEPKEEPKDDAKDVADTTEA